MDAASNSPAQPLLKNTDVWGRSDVVCPQCGFDYVPMQMVSVYQGPRVDIITRAEHLRRVHDDVRAGSRGTCVKISMWCENGHAFDVVFDFAKGKISLLSADIHELDHIPTEELWRE